MVGEVSICVASLASYTKETMSGHPGRCSPRSAASCSKIRPPPPPRVCHRASSFSIMCSLARRKLPPDWSSLPADVIEFISSLVADDSDYVRFRSVCYSWRSAAPKRPLIPWLLVKDYDPDPNTLSLCNFPNSNFSSTPRLPRDIVEGKLLCGSSFGWIALLDDSPIFSLHNPFIDAHINLPPLYNLPWIEGDYVNGDRVFRFSKFPDYLAWKLVLSSDPRIQSCIAMAFSHNHRRLIYCHPGDGSWTPLPPLPIDDDEMLDDILFYRGKFYVVWTYKVFVCDIGYGNAQVTQVLPMDPLFSDGKAREGYSRDKTSHLVDSSGDLLLVSVKHPHVTCNDPNCDDCGEFSFEVFRVDLDFREIPNGRLSLFKLDSLGGRSLFLSCDSTSVSACDSPSCKGNSIYLINNGDAYICGVFVFSMEDDSFSSVTGFSQVPDYSSETDSDDDTFTGFSEKRAMDFRLNWLTPSLC